MVTSGLATTQAQQRFWTLRRLRGAISFWLKHPSLPGPQMRGTGGTLTVVWKGHLDRGHPPTTEDHAEAD